MEYYVRDGKASSKGGAAASSNGAALHEAELEVDAGDVSETKVTMQPESQSHFLHLFPLILVLQPSLACVALFLAINHCAAAMLSSFTSSGPTMICCMVCNKIVGHGS